MNDRDIELLEITDGIKELAVKYGCKSRVIDTLNDTKSVISEGDYNIRTVTGTLYDVLDLIEKAHPELSRESVDASVNAERKLHEIISDCHRSLDNLQSRTETGIISISSHTEREFSNMISKRLEGEDFIKGNVINTDLDRLTEKHVLDITRYKRRVLDDNAFQYDQAVKKAVNSNLISEKTAYTKWNSRMNNIKMGIDGRMADVRNGSEVLKKYKADIVSDTAEITQKERKKKNIKLLVPFIIIMVMLITAVVTTFLVSDRLKQKAKELIGTGSATEQTAEQTTSEHSIMEDVENVDHIVDTLDNAKDFIVDESVQTIIKNVIKVLLVVFAVLILIYLIFFIYQNATLKKKIYTKVQGRARENLSGILNSKSIENLDRECIMHTNALIRGELDAIMNEVLYGPMNESGSLVESPIEVYRNKLGSFLN